MTELKRRYRRVTVISFVFIYAGMLAVALLADHLPTRLRIWPTVAYCVMFGVLAVIIVRAGARAGFLEMAKHRCRECGYNLRGNTSGRCPECGAPTSRTPDH